MQKYQLLDTTNPANHKILKLQQTQYNDVKVSPPFANQAGIALIFIVFFSGLVTFLNKRYLNNKSDNWFNDSKKTNYKLSCITCRFYSNNHYLPCAVHPSTAITEEARDCSDYSIKDEKLFSKNKFKFWK